MHDGSAIRSNKLDANSFSIAKIGKIGDVREATAGTARLHDRPAAYRAPVSARIDGPRPIADEEDAARRPQRWPHFLPIYRRIEVSFSEQQPCAELCSSSPLYFA